MNAHYKARVVLLNLPIRPLSALAYYVAFKAGLIHKDALVRLCQIPEGKIASIRIPGSGSCDFSQPMILDFSAVSGSLAPQVNELINRFWPRQNRRELNFVRRCCTYLASSQKDRTVYNHLAAITIANGYDPKSITDTIVRMFDNWMAQCEDPWKEPFSITMPEVLTNQKVAIPPDTKFIDLPFYTAYDTVTEFDNDQKGIREEAILEGMTWHLQKRCVKIMIAGFPNTGKSTAAYSIFKVCSNILKSLRTRAGWQEFDCKVGMIDLDLGTPTINEIKRGLAQDRAHLAGLKTPWTQEKALEASRLLHQASQEYNIVIADAPGMITSITEFLVSQVDVGIMIGGENYEHEKPILRDLFRSLGVPVVARIRSRHRNEKSSSMIRHFEPGRCLSGRVTSLERNERSFDPFIILLSELMLFSILPEFHLGRIRAVEAAYRKK